MGNSCCNNFFSPGQSSLSPAQPVSCTGIDCSSYSPTCFTPASTNLCGYLQGINNQLCYLNSNCISCSRICDLGPYSCMGVDTTGNNLCTILTAINNTLCSIEHPIPVWPVAVAASPIVDGDNGTFTGSNTLTGLIASSNVTPTADSTLSHGTSANSLRLTSTSTETGNISTSTAFAVEGGQNHTVRVYVYFTAGSAPVHGVVTVIVNGTGSQIQYPITENSTTNDGRWVVVNTEYIPDINQEVTVTIQVTEFTSGTYVNLADLVFEVNTLPQGGENYQFYIPQQYNIEALYKSIGVSFVYIGGNQTNTDLTATLAFAIYNMFGTVVAANATTLTLQASTYNFVYYDTWISGYAIKTNSINEAPLPDSTQMLLWMFETNGSAVTSYADLRVTTPFVGTSIAPGTITGTQIAAATIADSNMTTTGVTPGTYIGSVTVNSTGRITASANVFTIVSPLENAHMYYDTVSGQFKNTQAFTIDSGTTTLTTGTYVSSPALTLRGYYSPSGTGVSYDAVLKNVMTANTPASAFQVAIGGNQVFSVNSNGNFATLNTLGAPGSPLSGGYYQYSANITIHTVTKAAPTFMDGFGNIIQLTQTNLYSTAYATYATSISAYTSNSQGSAYTGIAYNVSSGTPYAQVTDLNSLRVAYENLLTSYNNILAVVNQMVADLTTLGIFGLGT